MLVDGKLDISTTGAPMMFKTFAQKWLDGYVENNLKWNSRRYYADMIRRIPDDLQRKTLSEITREDVRKVAFGVLEQGLSRGTARGLIRTISAIFGAAAEDGVYRGANPALKPGRILRTDYEPGHIEDEEIDCMSQEEAKHFLKVVQGHFGANYPIFLTALRTGARQGELIGLTWDAIDRRGSFLTIRQTIVNGEPQSTKSDKIRHIPMSKKLARTLQKLHKAQSEIALSAGREMRPWVFQNSDGGPVDPSKLRKVFGAILRKAGIRALTFHSLRRTALTTMAENGVPMVMLQKIAGHSDITTTARYYIKIDAKKAHKDVIAALDMMDDESAPQAHPASQVVSLKDPNLLK